MNPSNASGKGIKCFKCGKESTNIHLCKVAGVSQIICDNCCKKLLEDKKCQHRECGHYRTN